VAVHVTENYDLVFTELFDQIFAVVDSRVQQFGGLIPSSIQVNTQGIASVVPSDDTIRVQHGHYLENELLSKVLSFFSLRDQIVNCALSHKL